MSSPASSPGAAATLRGRVVLVTGAASGIGRACAARYADEGAIVIAADIAGSTDTGSTNTGSTNTGSTNTGSTNTGSTNTGSTNNASVSGLTHRHLDVADADAWRALAGDVMDEFGRLDLLHLNAGIRLGVGDVTALDDEDYLRVIGVNQHGVLYGLRAMLPLLEADGGGAVMVTASRASLGPLPNDLAYAMSKHAIIGLVRSVAMDLEGRGVTINAICPATVDTGFIADAGRDRLEAAGIAVMDAEEVADGVLAVLATGESGQCYVQLPGASPTVFEFAPVPGR